MTIFLNGPPFPQVILILVADYVWDKALCSLESQKRQKSIKDEQNLIEHLRALRALAFLFPPLYQHSPSSIPPESHVLAGFVYSS